MTNEEAKQEAIKKAYLDLGNTELSELYVDEFGFSQKSDLLKNFNSKNYHSLAVKSINNTYKYRPRSIEFIGDNNGWIRIEPDGSNLPTDKSVRYKVCRGQLTHHTSYTLSEALQLHIDYELTHYKPITPEEPPIY